MAHPVTTLEMSLKKKEDMEWLVRAAATSWPDCLRACILLLCDKGIKQVEVARRSGTRFASIIGSVPTLRRHIREQTNRDPGEIVW